MKVKYQYFSKHRHEWVDFKKEPTPGQIKELEKYFYRVRKVPVKEGK